MFKKASKSVFTSTVVVSLDCLSLTPLTSSAVRTPENMGKDHDDPESAEEGDAQMEYSPVYLYSPSIGAVTQNYL
jgi:hypothetical protein